MISVPPFLPFISCDAVVDVVPCLSCCLPLPFCLGLFLNRASTTWQQAVQMAITDFNSATPLTSGTVTLVASTDPCNSNGAGAYSSLSTMSTSNVLTGVIGPLCSFSQASASPLAGYLSLPLVVPAHVPASMGAINATMASAPPLSDSSSFSISLRPPPMVEARAMVSVVKSLNWTSIAVVWIAGGCSEDEATAFVQAAQKAGVSIIPLPVAAPVTAVADAVTALVSLTATGVKVTIRPY
jgi:ABC-type branched-subunit amino acid transport system substrate-binding protein